MNNELEVLKFNLNSLYNKNLIQDENDINFIKKVIESEKFLKENLTQAKLILSKF